MFTCSICLNDILDDILVPITCKHKFHGSCLTEWLKHNNSCPLCRTPVKRVYEIYSVNDNSKCLIFFKDERFGFKDIDNKKFNRIFLYQRLKSIKMKGKELILRILDSDEMIDYTFITDKKNILKIFDLIKYIIKKKVDQTSVSS